jgi:hypothetical protein
MKKPARRKSWQEKMDGAPDPHAAVLERAFAGYPAGTRLWISSPRDVAAAIRRIPPGQTWTVAQLRDKLAQDDRAQDALAAGTCPLTTGIFVRIAAERAWEELQSGAPIEEVTPFWRVVAPTDPVAKKLACGLSFLVEQRAAEA